MQTTFDFLTWRLHPLAKFHTNSQSLHGLDICRLMSPPSCRKKRTSPQGYSPDLFVHAESKNDLQKRQSESTCSDILKTSSFTPHACRLTPTKNAQRDLNPRFRLGKAVGYRYLMSAVDVELSKINRKKGQELSEIRGSSYSLIHRVPDPFFVAEHRVGLEPTSLLYESSILPLDDQCDFKFLLSARRELNP